MPVKPFELSRQAEKRRKDFKIFICSALIGTGLGILAALLGSLSFTQLTVYAIIGVIVFIIVLVFYTMKVVLKPDDIHHILTIYLAYDKDKGMFVPITNNFSGFVLQSFMKFRDGAKSSQEPVVILKKGDIHSIEKLAMDLVTYAIFDWLSQKYAVGWAPKMMYSGVAYSRFSFKTESQVGSKTIQYSNLPEELKKDNLFFRLYGESMMTLGRLAFSVPSNTKLKSRKAGSRKFVISFCNKYCNIEITVSNQHWMVGLHPLWGRFVVAKGRERDDSLSYLQEHYAHITLEMSFHIKFSWLWSLMSSSDDYSNWAEDMYDGADDFFSFEKEYSALEKMDHKIELD